MSADCFNDLREHVGHKIVCVLYGEADNVALECETCSEVLVDYDNDNEDEEPD